MVNEEGHRVKGKDTGCIEVRLDDMFTTANSAAW